MMLSPSLHSIEEGELFSLDLTVVPLNAEAFNVSQEVRGGERRDRSDCVNSPDQVIHGENVGVSLFDGCQELFADNLLARSRVFFF